MRKFITLALAAVLFAACAKQNDKMSKCENDSWDKVFPLSEKVSHKKVSFPTQYGITLVADLYSPKASIDKCKNEKINLSAPRIHFL